MDEREMTQVMAAATLPEFRPFESIARLKRSCVVTEKIDGTNAQIWISDDLSIVAAGSRTRWITPSDDNYGFARWVQENAENLRALGPGRHYGEWWGAGIQRRYGLSEKRFSLFNVGRWSNNPYPACCSLVPVLHEGEFSTDAVDNALERLKSGGSVAAPDFMDPEGVVVYMPQSRTLYKVTLGGDGHKSARLPKSISGDIEAGIIDAPFADPSASLDGAAGSGRVERGDGTMPWRMKLVSP